MNGSLAGRAVAGLSLLLAGCSEITPSTDKYHTDSPSARIGSPSFIQISSFTVSTDVGGANDVPSQSDLTQFGVDNSSNDTTRVFWSWDATDDWTAEGQTGNACALFDTDDDGLVNLAVCAQIANVGGDPGQVLSTTGSPWVFTCADAKNDRCTTPTAVSYTGLQIQSSTQVTETDPFNNLNPDQNWPWDASVEIAILKSFLPAAATVINVCSYPSATNGGNNNPLDCILAPRDFARLDLVVTSTTSSITQAGQSLPYSYLVTNTGTLPATNVIVADSLGSVVTCPQASIAINESMTCSGSHTVTFAELNGDSLVNVATVDSDETDAFAFRLSIPIASSPALAQIVDARTACRTYTAGTAGSIESVTYSLRNGLISQVSQRSVVYFATLVAPATGFGAAITQVNGSGWQPLKVDTRAIAIYEAGCRRAAARYTSSFNSATGETTIALTNATAGGTYYFSVEYVLSDLLKKTVVSPSATFTFAVRLDGSVIAATQRGLNILPR